jgi:hypothetical protein
VIDGPDLLSFGTPPPLPAAVRITGIVGDRGRSVGGRSPGLVGAFVER